MCQSCKKEIEVFAEPEFFVCSACRDWHEESRKIYINENQSVRKRKEVIPASLRWSVFERDNFTCQNCGSRKNLTIDHVVPESKGGGLTMDNTQTLCKSCNSRKGAK